MSELLARLLGIAALDPSDPLVEFGFERPIPAWGWAAVAVAAAVAAAWGYARIEGPRWARLALGGVRGLLLLLLALLISGPRLARTSERVERDWAAVLLDRSASMQIPDAPAGATRGVQQRDALERGRAGFDALADRSNTLWLGFDAGVFDLPEPERAGDPGAWTGRATDLNAALEETLRRLSGRPAAGVVLLTDGRSRTPVSRAVIRRLQADGIRVFPLPLGSRSAPPDAAVVRAEAPSAVFVGDIVPVRVRARSTDPSAESITIELIDPSGNVRDRREAPLTQDPEGARSGEATLTFVPDAPGRGDWTVRVADAAGEVITSNNAAAVPVAAVERTIRVLYIDGYPRWEYRYLKNLLLRERSVRASAMLLAADRKFIQEGTEPLSFVPVSPEEWAPFDVIILGDVRAELFAPEQLEHLREHVATRGAGLLWIAGPSATPGSWQGTALSDLIPFDAGGPDSAAIDVFAGPVTLRRSPGAERLGLLNLAPEAGAGWPEELADPALGWTRLWWAQRLDRAALKPTAEVLAEAIPDQPGAPTTPLVLAMRFGAGRAIYTGTDETWRWRYARGEPLPERFWLPLIRLLARETLARSGASAVLEVSPERSGVGAPVRLALRLLDQRLADNRPDAADLTIRPADPADGGPIPARLRAEPGDPRTLSDTWIPDAPGRYIAEINDPAAGGTPLSAEFEVFAPDDELRSPEADHAALEALAEQTGGSVLSPEQLADLASLLPNRQVRVSTTPEVEPLWDSPLALATVLLLLTLEWVGRRLIRLI